MRLSPILTLAFLMALSLGLSSRASVASSPLDYLQPKKTIFEIIEKFSAEADRLQRRFGHNIDIRAGNALLNFNQIVQQLRYNAKDIVKLTFENISSERKEIFNNVASLLINIDNSLSNNIKEISKIEANISNTLTNMTRANTTPFVNSITSLILTDSASTNFSISGQNLGNANNKITLGSDDITVSTATNGENHFILPFSSYSNLPEGPIKGQLTLFNQTNRGPKTISLPITFFKLGNSAGTYSVYFDAPTARYSTNRFRSQILEASVGSKNQQKRESICFSPEPGYKIIAGTIQLFEKSSEGEYFELDCIVRMGLILPGDPGRVERECKRRGHIDNADAFQVATRSESQACFHVVASSEGRNKRIYLNARTRARITFDQRSIEPIYETNSIPEGGPGTLGWNTDVQVTIPDRSRNIYIKFKFAATGEERILNTTDRYGPFEVRLLDRILVLRATR